MPVSIRVPGPPFSTLIGSCGVFKAELSPEIELIPFMTSRDNPCHGSVPMGISRLKAQHRKLQFGKERELLQTLATVLTAAGDDTGSNQLGCVWLFFLPSKKS